ncbi:hypothetical protein E4631_20145 [Hymenobacter sp. UV11]|uniref:hypothetical protein n=1 Tax=Hymenobacter sp. UV11 TaxID=1849735 RepID=UPI00105ED640|nr:hypothetical protein [Hymenobacter sp. UV11]TDN36933.1 hypothetical protein A8B98_05925 [Hymenobacter sp. UV11]TFZ64311.1 hypothetical protein E4631_20145 [Hymenobacter sp. UV11]
MNVTRQTLLLGWGLTVTGAYLLTEYLGHALEEPHSAILWTWAGAMLLPVGLTLALGRQANALGWVWAGATALVLLENFGAHAAEVKLLMQFSFHALWFLFGAAGFAYTAMAVKGTARKQLYAGAALLNLLGAIMAGLNPNFLKGYQYLVLALIQGVPMLLDLPLRRQHEVPVNH